MAYEFQALAQQQIFPHQSLEVQVLELVVWGQRMGYKEGQRVRHGDKEVRPEAGGHCIKNNAKKNIIIN